MATRDRRPSRPGHALVIRNPLFRLAGGERLSCCGTAPLFFNHDAEYDWLIALRYGLVDDALTPEQREVVVDGRFAYVREPADGPTVGFTVLSFSTFDPESDAARRLWEPPIFDAPVLGLRE